MADKIDKRVMIFQNPQTAAEYFSITSVEKEGERKEQKEAGQSQEGNQEGKKRKSVFERLGERPPKRPRNQQNKESAVQYPQWKGYALIGDSIMVRVCKELQVPTGNSSLCRGGLTLAVCQNILAKMKVCPKNIVLFIGINDIMRGTSKYAVKQLYMNVLQILEDKGAEKVVLMEVLPILTPSSWQHVEALKFVNKSLQDMSGGKVELVRTHHLFMQNKTQGKGPNAALYEGCHTRQRDVLHPNRTGLQQIVKVLKTQLLLVDVD